MEFINAIDVEPKINMELSIKWSGLVKWLLFLTIIISYIIVFMSIALIRELSIALNPRVGIDVFLRRFNITLSPSSFLMTHWGDHIASLFASTISIKNKLSVYVALSELNMTTLFVFYRPPIGIIFPLYYVDTKQIQRTFY